MVDRLIVDVHNPCMESNGSSCHTLLDNTFDTSSLSLIDYRPQIYLIAQWITDTQIACPRLQQLDIPVGNTLMHQMTTYSEANLPLEEVGTEGSSGHCLL